MDQKKVQSILQENFWSSLMEHSSLMRVSGFSESGVKENAPAVDKKAKFTEQELFLLREQIASSIVLVRLSENSAQLKEVYVLDAMGLVDGAGSSSRKIKKMLKYTQEPIHAHMLHCDPEEKRNIIEQLARQHEKSSAQVRYGQSKSEQWIAIPVEDLLHLKPLGEQYAQKYKTGTIGSLAWFEQLERSLERINKNALEYLEKYHPNSRALELVTEYQLRHDYLHWEEPRVGGTYQSTLGFAAVRGARGGAVFRGQRILHSGVDVKDAWKSKLKMERPKFQTRSERLEKMREAERLTQEDAAPKVKEKHTLDVIKEMRKDSEKMEKAYEEEKKELLELSEQKLAIEKQKAAALEEEKMVQQAKEELQAATEAKEAKMSPPESILEGAPRSFKEWLARPSPMWHRFFSFVERSKEDLEAVASEKNTPGVSLMDRLQAFRQGRIFKQMLESEIEWSDNLPMAPAALPEPVKQEYDAQEQQERMVQRALERRALRAQEEGVAVEDRVPEQPYTPRRLPTPRPRFRPW